MLWKQHFLLANREKGQTSKQAGRQASRRAGEQASRQTGRQANREWKKIWYKDIQSNNLSKRYQNAMTLWPGNCMDTNLDCQYRPSLNKVLAYESRSDRSNGQTRRKDYGRSSHIRAWLQFAQWLSPKPPAQEWFNDVQRSSTSLTLAEGALHQETKPAPNSARSKFKFHQIPASCTSKKLSVQGFSVGNQISSTHFESLTIHTPTC